MAQAKFSAISSPAKCCVRWAPDEPMDGPLRTTRRGRVLEALLERPPANAIAMATSRAMGECFADFRDDPGLRVAIIRSASANFFSAGRDRQEASGGAPPDS